MCVCFYSTAIRTPEVQVPDSRADGEVSVGAAGGRAGAGVVDVGVRIMVCRSMLASDSGEMDSALFLLSRGVSRGLENRDTAQRRHKGFRAGGGLTSAV